MTRTPKCYGVIPARYQSKRFPGKPLADIMGKPMFWHVYQRAIGCRDLQRVLLATDDERIRSRAQSLDVPVVMTRPDHPSGTDRVLEAAQLLGIAQDAVVVNIQGDEPLIEPGMLSDLLAPFQTRAEVAVTTLARRMDPRRAPDPDRVKVVFDAHGRALYFSRAPIPYARTDNTAAFFGHIGLYAFRVSALERFVALGPSRLEKIERLEQLRLLENHIPLHVVVTEHESIGVDRPPDLERVLRRLKQQNT